MSVCDRCLIPADLRSLYCLGRDSCKEREEFVEKFDRYITDAWGI